VSKATNTFKYLADIYCVFKTAFILDFGKKTKARKSIKKTNRLIHIRDIYCVFKTAFSFRPVTKPAKKTAKKHSGIWNVFDKLYPRGLARFLFAQAEDFKQISIFLSRKLLSSFTAPLRRFSGLHRLNQGIIMVCLIVITAASAFPAWLMYSQDHFSQTGQYSDVVPYSAPNNSVAGLPVGLSIPSLDIYLPVIKGQYDPSTNNWTLTDSNAQYMVDSAKPNNIAGKTFIYGHALRNIFGKLPYIQPGAELSLTTSNGYRFNYRFDSSFATAPSDLSVLDNSKKPVLYVQTCSGVFYQNRQIFSFDYIGYERIKA
jgi:LPXTG-site transpeptidase (sortase) family protein